MGGCRGGGGVKLAMVVAADLGRYMKLLLALSILPFLILFYLSIPAKPT